MEHPTGKRYTQLYYKLNKRLFFNLTLYPRNAIAHLATCRGPLQELSTKEIAEKLGIAPHSVIVQRSRALEHLRISFNTKTKDNAPTSNRTDSTNHTGGKGNK